MIFVFGSNLAGRHGAGAARWAYQVYSAEYGVGVGPTGMAYAIPTKDYNILTMPLEDIKPYVDKFLAYAKEHPELEFKVTRIGCGLAGYTEADICPMFEGAPSNCHLPGGWHGSTEE